MKADTNIKWKWCRDISPEIFDRLASEYAEMRGIQLPSAKAMIARNVARLIEGGIILKTTLDWY